MKANSINGKGCSICELGKEHYTTYSPVHRPKQTFYQYDYRHTDGELFSTVAKTLEECRTRRDKWLNERNQKYTLFVGMKKLGKFTSISQAKQYAKGSGYTGAFNLLGKDYRDSWFVFEKQDNNNETGN